jgi:hypothetical protein
MRNRLFLLLLILGGLSLSSCEQCVRGEGDPVVQVLEIPEFTALHLSGSHNVNLVQGVEQKVEITAPANIIELLNRSVRNNTWEISFEECVRAKNIQINITVSSLSAITVSGSGDIKGMNNLNVENIEINVTGSGNVELMLNARNTNANISGSGDIKLSGSGTSLKATVTGSGDINARDFSTVRTNVEIIGSGDAFVNASELYEVSINGSGDVQYRETGARIVSDVRGTGEITRR